MATEIGVTVSYYDPFGAYSVIQSDLERLSPLTNLHWKCAPRPLRSIGSLPLNLIEEAPLASVPQKHQLPGMDQSPFVKIIVIQCDDIDIYRASARNIAREWLNINVNGSRDPTEWFILYIMPADPKKSLYDKIKSNFCPDTNKCIAIPHDSKNSRVWSSVIELLKASVLNALTKRVTVYESEISKLWDQKSLPGWNFGSFFVTKESLALSFEHMALLDDALAQYDDLEATFNELNQTTQSFLDSKQPESFLLSCNPFTLNDQKSTRLSIIENKLSLLEFLFYLFSRQCQVLFKMSKLATTPSAGSTHLADIVTRTRDFVLRLRPSMRFNHALVCEWALQLLTTVLDQVEVDTSNPKSYATLLSAKSGMVLFARDFIIELGEMKGWSVALEQEIDLSKQPADQAGDPGLISSIMLKDILKSEDSWFESFHTYSTKYLELNGALLESSHSADLVNCQLALAFYDRKDYESAAKYFASIPLSISLQKWQFLSISLLTAFADTMWKTENYSFFARGAVALIFRHKQILQDSKLQELSENLAACSKMISESLSFGVFDAKVFFDIQFAEAIHFNELDDATFLKASLKNLLPVDLHIDTITADLLSDVPLNGKSNSIVLPFSAHDISLKHSDAIDLDLRCTTLTSGLYKVARVRIVSGKFTFVMEYKVHPELIIVQNPNGFDVFPSFPSNQDLKSHKYLVFSVKAGCKDINSAKIELNSPFLGHKFDLNQIKITGISDYKVEDHLIHIKEPIMTGTAIEIAVPLDVHFQLNVLNTFMRVEFYLNDEKFVFMDTISSVIDAPISILVQDVFCANSLLWKFSFSVGKAKRLNSAFRLISSKIKGNDCFSIHGPGNSLRTLLVTEGRPVTNVYRIKRTTKPLISEKQLLTLELQYSSVNNDVRQTLFNKLEQSLKEYGCYDFFRLFRRVVYDILIDDQIECSPWGEIKLPSLLRPTLEKRLKSAKVSSDIQSKILDKVLADYSLEECEHQVSSLEIQVSIPSMEYLYEAELQIPFDSRITVGKPVKAILKITPNTIWKIDKDDANDNDDSLKDAQCFYEVSADSWLISGPTRAHFGLNDSVHANFEIIPIKEGYLNIPQVLIWPQQKIADKITIGLDYTSESVTVPVFSEHAVGFYSVNYSDDKRGASITASVTSGMFVNH
ncbi:hypothetical protein CANCADRAFT_44869 [Tortispora caseinolytica NRRL Y-17796]|uniref:Trafficking protein particle complex subunit 11 domain-containing protein n=1 Tax=Tortispora caseinolytica NRRL Y-17796 TaxID=767744 RepID=A0A1E4THP3_9ASCO|nr:hypothetical protein CANCADRAFT_44869 [Tortispora caseinolytica NRRL Y-17796]